MNTPANPYAPPTAQVQDLDSAFDEYQAVRLWPASGRIGRLRFLGYSMGAYLVFAVLIGISTALAGASAALSVLLTIVGFIFYFFVVALLTIQRSHDMDMSGWMSLLALIPLVGLYWIFKGGSPGANRFGAPPPPNTTGVKILAWLLIIIPVIGILAAVAIPAYQQYTVRANAAQVR